MDTVSYIISIPLRLICIVLSVPLVLFGKLYDLFFKRFPPEPHNILITGANSGICKEVAIKYAKPGNTLVLLARNKERLNEIAESVRGLGASVIIKSIDATNKEEMFNFIKETDKRMNLDLVVAGIGAVAPSNANEMELSEVYDFIIDANITTCKNTILPIIDSMRARRSGQICILSSVAGLDMNFISPMYASCKMSVFAFGEALRVMLEQYGVRVSIVCPGYTDTPILDTNTGKNVGWKLTPEAVADMIVTGLKRDYYVIECDMMYNLVVACGVSYIPKIARDYLFRMLIPFAKRNGMFANEYPAMERIYTKEKND